MKIKKSLLIFLILFSNLIQGQNLTNLNNSVVKVVYSCADLGKAKSGTGFVWKKSNQIITALHLVTGSCKNSGIYIYIPSDNKLIKSNFYPAKVIKILKSADLVLLEADIPKLPVLSTIGTNLFIKQNVEALGYVLNAPSKRSIQLTIPFNESKKLVTNIPPTVLAELNKLSFNASMEVVHFQGSLLPGLSGAPIFNNKNEIIAIGNGGLSRGQVGISWGIPASKIIELENSTEDIKTIDSIYAYSSDIAFSSEVPINISSLGEDFFIKEKESLQKDMFTLDKLEFYNVGQKSFSDILKYSIDQNGLTQLINYFQKTDVMKSNFSIYRNFETGATFVLPINYKVIKKGDKLVFQTVHNSLKIKLDYFKLNRTYDMTYELCENNRLNRPIDSLAIWQKFISLSYANPIVTLDGQYINREAYNKSIFTNSNITDQLTFQFISTVKKNNDLFFLSLTDDEGTTNFNQKVNFCLQDSSDSSCSEVLTKYKEIALLVFCQHLFSFSY